MPAKRLRARSAPNQHSVLEDNSMRLRFRIPVIVRAAALSTAVSLVGCDPEDKDETGQSSTKKPDKNASEAPAPADQAPPSDVDPKKWTTAIAGVVAGNSWTMSSGWANIYNNQLTISLEAIPSGAACRDDGLVWADATKASFARILIDVSPEAGDYKSPESALQRVIMTERASGVLGGKATWWAVHISAITDKEVSGFAEIFWDTPLTDFPADIKGSFTVPLITCDASD
jgi:hypothetical protein